MGVEIKRVPLDLEFTIGEVWPGYINPHAHLERKCEHCDGSGYSPVALELKNKWYGFVDFDPAEVGSSPYEYYHPAIVQKAKRNLINHQARLKERSEEIVADLVLPETDDLSQEELKNLLTKYWGLRQECRRLANVFNTAWTYHINQQNVDDLLEDGRLMCFTHKFVEGEGWVKDDTRPKPTAAQVNEWCILTIGHDCINFSTIVKAECKRRGVSHICSNCEGNGTAYETPEARNLCENWEPVQPPSGDGWQLWESVSEGSPISPVFETKEGLAAWLSMRDIFSYKHNYATWMRFIDDGGYAPSGIVENGKFKSGVAMYEEDSDVDGALNCAQTFLETNFDNDGHFRC